MKLNAVFDTNLLIFGILWKGIPFKLLGAMRDVVNL